MTKPLFTILLFTCSCFSGCETRESKIDQTIHEVDSKKSEEESNRASIQTNLREEVNHTKSHPDWIDSLYYDSIKINYASNLKRREIVDFKRLNDSVTFCIYETSDALCLERFMASQVFRKEKQVVQLTKDCDHDQKAPIFIFYDYILYEDTCAIVLETKEYIPDSLLEKDGIMEKDKYFDDYLHETEETTYYYSVSMTGEIIKS